MTNIWSSYLGGLGDDCPYVMNRTVQQVQIEWKIKILWNNYRL